MGSTIWVDGPGSRLAVYVSGASTDPVVLLHGGPGVPDYLAPVAEILALRHQVIRYDQRGTGQSTAEMGGCSSERRASRRSISCSNCSITCTKFPRFVR